MDKKSGKEEVILFPDTKEARAEDLLRAPVENAMSDMLGKPDHPDSLKFVGKYMARLIAVIKSGESQDIEPANGWTDQDKADAAKTSLYLIGGAIASKPAGAEIMRYAAEELKNLGITDIKLTRYTGENVAARAAATLVPASEYRGAARGQG